MKGGIVCQKKEMTKLWLDGKFEPVTILLVAPQEVLRYKSVEKDGYEAVVVGVEKKEKNEKVAYKKMVEFKVDGDFQEKFQSGKRMGLDCLEGVDSVDIVGVSKGKGFQGAMKIFHLAGGNQTRGSKFHRRVGSMGNRKPRRTQKGHPHAARMGGERITLARRAIVGRQTREGEELVLVKGSVPGAYNGFLQLVINK